MLDFQNENFNIKLKFNIQAQNACNWSMFVSCLAICLINVLCKCTVDMIIEQNSPVPGANGETVRRHQNLPALQLQLLTCAAVASLEGAECEEWRSSCREPFILQTPGRK